MHTYHKALPVGHNGMHVTMLCTPPAIVAHQEQIELVHAKTTNIYAAPRP